MSYHIDLHTHTNASDGTLTPTELVNDAFEHGIKVIAITDHETIDGIDEARIAAKEKNIEIIPGIEISCDEENFKDIHIIGLFIDDKNPNIIEFCNKVKEERIQQKKQMIEVLIQHGLDITFEEVAKLVKYSFGRPHIAHVLVKKYPERFPNIQSVFDTYLGRDKLAYIPRKNKTAIRNAVDLINKAKGIAILAHPGRESSHDKEKIIQFFKSNGGEGLETNYCYEWANGISKSISDEMNNSFIKMAKELKLINSGGSDFHGSNRRYVELGASGIDVQTLDVIRQKHLQKTQ
jgi:3',5'-nucleoside bisphosphate phosphatase